MLLPARILLMLMGAPVMQLSAADTLRICPPCAETVPGKGETFAGATSAALRRFPLAYVSILADENNGYRPRTALGLSAYPLHDAAVYLHCCRLHLQAKPGAPNRTEEMMKTAVLQNLRLQLQHVKLRTGGLQGFPVVFKIKQLRWVQVRVLFF